MSDTAVSTFKSSLSELDVGYVRTDADGFENALASIVEEPAVGVPLDDYDGISLADTAVETPPTPRRLDEAETGVTPAGKAIAEYGSLVVNSDAAGTELVSLYCPTHVAVLRESEVLANVEDSTEYLDGRFATGGSSVFATGVSSTGDMGALVEGVHGPKHVHVIILSDR